MVTESTQHNNWSATLPAEALTAVTDHSEQLITAVYQALRQHVFENQGRLGAVRNLKPAAQTISQTFLQAMAGDFPTADIDAHILQLVEDGLGNESVLAVLEALLTEVEAALPMETTAVLPSLNQYRQHVLRVFMDAKLQQAARDHEQIYKSFNENLAKQVEQERQLRRSLQEEQQNAIKRAAGLEMITHVSTLAVSIREAGELLRRVCDQAQETLNLYHVQIYLLDDNRQQLILRGASGDIGTQLLDERRLIPIDQEQSIIAHTARQQQAVLANDVSADPRYWPDPLLPHTKAELAVPLLSEGEVLGVLDVQADELDVFSENDTDVLTTLATTIVVGLENINSFAQSRHAVEEMDVLARRLTQESWETHTSQQADAPFAYQYELGETTPLTEPAAWQTAVTPTNGTPIRTQPLTIYGAEIGRLSVKSESDDDEETAEIIASVAQQLAARVENLRLTEETQRALAQTEEQAKRLEAINQVAQTVSKQISLEPMLEAVYTQIRTIMKADSFWISFYDAEADNVYYPVIFEGDHRDYDLTRPLTVASSSRVALETGQPVMRHMTAEEAAQVRGSAQTLGDTSQDITKSSLFVPLTIGIDGKGVLSVQTYEFNAYTQSDVELLQGMGSYLAVAVENSRLFDETQDRAEQMAAINQLAQAVSQQLDLEKLLDTVYEQVHRLVDVDAFVAGLYDAASHTISYPLIREGEYRGQQGAIPVNPGSFAEQVISTGEYALRHYTEEEVAALSKTPSSSALGDTGQQHVASTLYVPLKIGANIIGVMSINSYEFNAYGENEVNLMLGVANFVSVALENVRLFAETQERAAQLEKLSEIERALSQAEDETAVVEALALYADEDQAITLQYVEETADDQPVLAYTAAHWENGQPQLDNEYLNRPFRIEEHAGLNEGLSRTREIIYISDVAKDPTVSGSIKQEAQKLNYGAVAVLPLRSGARWQGFVTFKWPRPHQFTEEEKTIWQQLREPVAAVVAGRRAFLAQQIALRETEQLYAASAELNRAQTYDDVVTVLRSQTILGHNSTNVSLNYFDRPWLDEALPEWISVLTRWTKLPQDALSMRYPLSAFPSAQQLLHSEKPTLVTNILTDPRLDDNVRALYSQRFQGQSTIFAPLVVGGQWVGYVNAIYPEEMQFGEAEVRRLLALTGQAAVSVQSIRLLEEATQRAQREQMLREITARVRSSTDVESVMRTAVQEVGRALGRKAFIQLEKKNGA